MEVLIDRIEEKNNWGKNELSVLIIDTITKYSNIVMRSGYSLDAPENTKECIVIDTCNHLLEKISTKSTWGKNTIKDIIFKKLAEKVSC